MSILRLAELVVDIILLGHLRFLRQATGVDNLESIAVVIFIRIRSSTGNG